MVKNQRHSFDSLVRKIPWRRAWQPTAVFLLGEPPWTEKPGGLQSMGSQRVGSDTTERLHFHFSLSCIGEGNGNPLQCSCLENPRDGGASWAAVYGVTQSQTRLKQLSSSSNSSSRNTSTQNTPFYFFYSFQTIQFIYPQLQAYHK